MFSYIKTVSLLSLSMPNKLWEETAIQGICVCGVCVEREGAARRGVCVSRFARNTTFVFSLSLFFWPILILITQKNASLTDLNFSLSCPSGT